jgi:D-glycero-D-manno-heptose 1,7-bisphosphate phosphatase
MNTCGRAGSPAAVFLDRDGVLIEDVHLLTRPEQVIVLPGVPQALQALGQAGFKLIVVSNQTVVARGLATEPEVQAVNVHLESLLQSAGAPPLDGIYICPHHPNATLPAYRVACDCRKPKPGLFLRAATELNLDLRTSFAVGDRITDIIAGAGAGCRTVLVQTGMHRAKPIETSEPLDTTLQPDYTGADLAAAAKWILSQCKM